MNKEKQIELTKFFKAIFEGTAGCIDIRTFTHTKKGDKIETRQRDHFFIKIKELKDLVRIISNDNFTRDRNVHFGVAPRAIAVGGKKQTGSENDVKFLNAIFCDVDCKRESDPGLPTKKETLPRIEKFELPPSIIVDSGLGYQVFWLLKVPIEIKSKKILLEMKGILKGLAQKLGGDVAAQDVSHLLRVPGSRNLKPECPKEGLEVKTIKFDPNLKYGPEFKKFMVKIEDLSGVDINIKDVKIPERFEKLLKKNKKLQNTYLTRNRPDLSDPSGSGYDMALANLLIKNKFTDSEIAAIIKSSKTGTKKKITPSYLKITIGKARAFEEKRKKGRKQEEPILKTFPPGLINLVNNEGVKKYLFKNEAGNLVITETWTDAAGIIYIPRQDLQIGYASTEILDIDIDKEINWTFLLRDIEKYIKGHLELPDKICYLNFGLWIMHTYLMEKIDITPYLYFVGLKGTGKSRAGQIAQKLAYKCLLETMPTAPVLFRTSDYFENALVNDEAKFWGSDMDKDVARIVMSKYKRGVTVLRINQDKKGERQIEIHNVFSPFIICTESNIPAAIEDRCIRFQMKKNKNPSVTGDWDRTEEQRLINLLTLFRAKYYNEEFPKHKNIAQWRLGEILSPLYKILLLVDKNRIEEFEGFIKEEETSRATDEATSDNATIISILINFYNEGEDIVATQDIAKRYNQDIENLNFQVSPSSMGWRIKPFNFKKKAIIKKGQNNKLGWIIDRETLIELAERFSTETEIIPVDEHLEKVKEETQLSMPD
ncbi:hypothetical protein ES708_21189 [subsurface metagenome]